MLEVSITEAKNHLPRIVQRAEAGEAVHITRRGVAFPGDEDFEGGRNNVPGREAVWD